MRKSKRETEETRKRIVEMAADEFRQHGIATSGIADLMAAYSERSVTRCGMIETARFWQ
jgi:hypothetical protein